MNIEFDVEFIERVGQLSISLISQRTIECLLLLCYTEWRSANIGQIKIGRVNDSTNEGRSPSVRRRSHSDAYQFVALDETRSTLKGFVLIRCPSRVMSVLLDLRPLAKRIWKNSNYRFLS